MATNRLAFAALLAFLIPTSGNAAPQQGIAFTNVQVISPCENRSWGPATIVVRDSLIVALDSAHKVTIQPDVNVRDLSGRYVIPGLIDSHFHVFQGDASPAAVRRMSADLQYLLTMGVTSIRDMAGDARILQQLSQDERQGAAIPRIFFAALFAGPPFSDPRAAAASQGVSLGQAPWMRLVSDTSDVESVVGAAKQTGATGIKLYADLSVNAITKLAAEAKRQGMRVWSHARIRPTLPRDVVRSGVETVSHAHHFLDELEAAENTRLREAAVRGEMMSLRSSRLSAVFDTMAARGVMFDPTLSLYEAEQTGRILGAGAIVNVARSSRVRILAGTDPILSDASARRDSLSPGHFPLVHRELELLVQFGGMSEMEALRAATCHAAEAMGMIQRLGYLRTGQLADFIVLGSNPIERISNVRDTRLVIKNGSVVVER